MPEKTYRMLLIDPEQQAVTEHQVDPKDWTVMGAMIGSPAMSDTFRLADHGDTFDYGMVDDGGLVRGEPIHAFGFLGFSADPIAGKCLVYGADKLTGATCSAKFPVQTLCGVIRWLGLIVPKIEWIKEGNVDRAKVTWSAE